MSLSPFDCVRCASFKVTSRCCHAEYDEVVNGACLMREMVGLFKMTTLTFRRRDWRSERRRLFSLAYVVRILLAIPLVAMLTSCVSVQTRSTTETASLGSQYSVSQLNRTLRLSPVSVVLPLTGRDDGDWSLLASNLVRRQLAAALESPRYNVRAIERMACGE